jgi:hypothetical protein
LFSKRTERYLPNWKIDTNKELSSNIEWLREAKSGLFTHYLAHTANTKVSEEMNAKRWNEKVNSFQVKKFGEQLSKVVLQ